MKRIHSRIFGDGVLQMAGTDHAWARFEQPGKPSLIIQSDGHCSISGVGGWLDLPCGELGEMADEVDRILREVRGE